MRHVVDGRDGILQAGGGAEIERVMRKLHAGERITVALVGGSVSVAYALPGGGASDAYYGSWARKTETRRGLTCDFDSAPSFGCPFFLGRLVQWLRRTWPANHSAHVAGSGAGFFAHISCIGSAIPDNADVVILDGAINTPRPAFDHQVERVLRLLRAREPPPAVVFLNFFGWCRDVRGGRGCAFNAQPANGRADTALFDRTDAAAGDELAGRVAAAHRRWTLAAAGGTANAHANATRRAEAEAELFILDSSAERLAAVYGAAVVSMWRLLAGRIAKRVRPFDNVRLLAYDGLHPSDRWAPIAVNIRLRRLYTYAISDALIALIEAWRTMAQRPKLSRRRRPAVPIYSDSTPGFELRCYTWYPCGRGWQKPPEVLSNSPAGPSAALSQERRAAAATAILPSCGPKAYRNLRDERGRYIGDVLESADQCKASIVRAGGWAYVMGPLVDEASCKAGSRRGGLGQGRVGLGRCSRRRPFFYKRSTKCGIVSLRRGDSITLAVSTLAQGVSAHSRRVEVRLDLLTSFAASMGRVSLACVGGCTCPPVEALTRVPAAVGGAVSVTRPVRLCATPHAQREIRATNMGGDSPRMGAARSAAGESKVKITAIGVLLPDACTGSMALPAALSWGPNGEEVDAAAVVGLVGHPGLNGSAAAARSSWSWMQHIGRSAAAALMRRK